MLKKKHISKLKKTGVHIYAKDTSLYLTSSSDHLSCKGNKKDCHDKETQTSPQSPSIPIVFNFLESTPDDNGDDCFLKVLNKEEKEYFMSLNGEARQNLIEKDSALKCNAPEIPVRFRVLNSRLPPEVKKKILEKLNRMNESITFADTKYLTWLATVLSLPLGRMLLPQPNISILTTMQNAKEHLNRVVYGHASAKCAILQRLYQWLINPLAPQRPLAFLGIPGNGKTSLARFGLANIMCRPFNFIGLGGNFDSSTLLGHSYTYEGSAPGRIVEHLIHSECDNPVYYFDELDKLSTTPRGEELMNTLIHFTDSTQNDKWKDRYIGNIDINVKCSLSVFSFNSTHSISPMLLDRLQIVRTDEFDCTEQAKIAATHLLPSILSDAKLKDPEQLVFDSEALVELCRVVGKGGLRQIRSVLEQAIFKGNMWIELEDDEFLKPLCPSDLKRTSSNRYILIKGLPKLIETTSQSFSISRIYS